MVDSNEAILQLAEAISKLNIPLTSSSPATMPEVSAASYYVMCDVLLSVMLLLLSFCD